MIISVAFSVLYRYDLEHGMEYIPTVKAYEKTWRWPFSSCVGHECNTLFFSKAITYRDYVVI